MSFHIDVSFHTTRMIALSDLCKLALPGCDVYIRNVTLRNKLLKDSIVCTLNYDLFTLPVLRCEVGHDPVSIPIPDSLRSLCGQWLYIGLEAVGDSIKDVWDSPLELCLSVSVERIKKEAE